MTESIIVQLKPMLQEFLVTIMEDTPQHEKVRSKVRRFVKMIVKPSPEGFKPLLKRDENHVELMLPNFEIADKRGNLYICDYNQCELENFLDDEFKSLMYIYLDSYLEFSDKPEIKTGIYKFLQEYRITSDRINYEMLKKSYYRYRKEKMQKKPQKLSKQLSSICPAIFLL